MGRHALLPLVSDDELNTLLNCINGTTCLSNGDDGGALEVLFREALDGRRHRGGEERRYPRTSFLDHRLAINVHLLALILTLHRVGGQLVEDERKLRLKPEVDHPICFVHDDVSALREDNNVSLNDVLETTRCGDDDLCTGTQVELLFLYGTLINVSKPEFVSSLLVPKAPIAINHSPLRQ